MRLLDFVRAFVFFILMNLVRYLMFILFQPLLNAFGYPISKKDIIVLTYGGLRGAIALIVAFFNYSDDALSKDFRHITLFFVGYNVLVSNLLNGMTIKYLLNKINFIQKSQCQEMVYSNSIK